MGSKSDECIRFLLLPSRSLRTSRLFTLSHRHTHHTCHAGSRPLTPPPRSDSTVHNVQTPCRPLRTRQGFRAYIIMCAIIMCVHIRSLLPLPLLLPIHPLHPVTSSHTPHLSRRFVSWPLTPPPRSDSFRSTVHNVQTPCRPLRTRQGGRVRGLQCLSCHMHTIRRPPAPVGPSHLRTPEFRAHIIMCAIIVTVDNLLMRVAPTTICSWSSSTANIIFRLRAVDSIAK